MTALRTLRVNALLTQAQLARKARLATRTVHSVEAGQRCRMDTRRKLLRALGVPFENWRKVFEVSA